MATTLHRQEANVLGHVDGKLGPKLHYNALFSRKIPNRMIPFDFFLEWTVKALPSRTHAVFYARGKRGSSLHGESSFLSRAIYQFLYSALLFIMQWKSIRILNRQSNVISDASCYHRTFLAATAAAALLPLMLSSRFASALHCSHRRKSQLSQASEVVRADCMFFACLPHSRSRVDSPAG